MARSQNYPSAPSGDNPSRQTPERLTKQEFGRRLFKMLESKGWNQSDLAREATTETTTVSRAAISKYVKGEQFPGPKILNALAAALDVDKSELLPNVLESAARFEAPEFQITVPQGHPGKAWLKIDRMTSMDTAVEIAALLNKEDGRD
jgi:transcriptional regulator with XRE-family HTH domain